MDVVFKEGMLYLQAIKFGKRSWRKIWMLLFKPSSTGVGRLEFYNISESSFISDQRKAGRQKTPERKVVRLSDCLSVVPAVKESCPPGCTAFYLKTMQYTYTFASMTSQDWLNAVSHLAFRRDPWESEKGDFEEGKGLAMEDNDLYSSWKNVNDCTESGAHEHHHILSFQPGDALPGLYCSQLQLLLVNRPLPPSQFQVKIQRTEASKRCRLAGRYLVSPDREFLVLLNIKTGGVIYQWPYKHLRKFGQVEGGFSIEAGRCCMSGEGLFTFLTSHASQILQDIAKACSIARTACAKPLSAHGHSFSDASAAAIGATANQITGPPVYDPADDSSDAEYQSVDDYCNDTVVQNMKPAAATGATATQITGPPVYDPADDSSDAEYQSVSDYCNDTVVQNMKRVSLATPHLSGSREALGKESQDEEERCHSMKNINLNNIREETIYDNMKTVETPLIRAAEQDYSDLVYSDVKICDSSSDLQTEIYSYLQPQFLPPTPPFALTKSDQYAQLKHRSLYPPTVDSYPQSCYVTGEATPLTRKTEIDDSDSIYSDVEKYNSFSDHQPELYSYLQPHSVTQAPPDVLTKSDQWAQPKRRSQYLPTVDDSLNPDYNPETQAVDELRDMGEEDVSATGCNTLSEAPGSFKHRLAEIISKDLAKFQPPLPSGAGFPMDRL